MQRDDQVVAFAGLAYLATLPPHERSLRRRALDVHAGVGKVEIRRKRLRDVAVRVALERECVRFVDPRNAARVEELREL